MSRRRLTWGMIAVEVGTLLFFMALILALVWLTEAGVIR